MITLYANNTKLSSPEIRRKFIMFSLLLLLSIFSGGCSSDLPKEHNVVEPQNGMIRIPLKEVDDGNVHFFTYKQGGQHINFFVRRDVAGCPPASTPASPAINSKKGTGWRARTWSAMSAD